MAQPQEQLDGRIRIVTPENIAFEYRVAGPFYRLPAYLIDFLIRLFVLIGLGVLIIVPFDLVGLELLAEGLLLMAWFLLEWFYGGLFETFWNGQTPGKRLMNVRVVSLDGQPINALQAVLRNLLRAVDLMPFGFPVPIPFGLVGLAACAMNDRYQRLGDLACGTMVVIEERSRLRGVDRVQETAVAELMQAIPAGFVTSSSLSRGLSMYVERRRNFAPPRRAEIARHLGQPLLERFQLPADTSHDLLLCALYNRTFITDRPGDETGPTPFVSPFVPATPAAVSPVWPSDSTYSR